MKITIDTKTEEDEEKILFYVKKFCREHFRDCKIYLNDDLKAVVDWGKE